MSDTLLRCFDLADKTACVTGAASGIGRATATLLIDLIYPLLDPRIRNR